MLCQILLNERMFLTRTFLPPHMLRSAVNLVNGYKILNGKGNLQLIMLGI
jgi:hypothetical protein